MAAPRSNSSNSSHSLVMEEMPEILTPAQQEARDILDHLLQRLKDRDSRYYPRYGKWVERNAKLTQFCLHCVKPRVWTALEENLDYETMKVIAGEFEWKVRGVYFNVMRGKQDSTTRLYIGQSHNLRWRIAQHTDFRHRRDKPSLHYHALQKSRENAFGMLCSLPPSSMGNHGLPGMDYPELLLNVLEMWMCLVWRCLPGQTLEEWLPVGVKRMGDLGTLNIQSPLENGDAPGKKRERVDLSKAEDPLVREWAEMKKLEWMGKQKKTEIPVPWLFAITVAVVIGYQIGRASRSI